ncbi:hypothetical protein SAMD00019534_090240 [Acytostelium subglobosum LB1]|uniref:hypothetical protein n=1 Tax=Acytostelium subglobosum LB1 TaxID=1410327 RepID=UPI0006450091|nr:hypothetical protein SAMD00019534_090240 [Acytostelium subglobosum LB1]GAM25849.1 hypothetical protein SAMD00019534_090240 [Acytostelium subglobosum LB1]|eukprot:XP_012751367.1 hypothetical protein SAMD00019534_090240 [Acytostelium subglobosum LB1]
MSSYKNSSDDYVKKISSLSHGDLVKRYCELETVNGEMAIELEALRKCKDRHDRMEEKAQRTSEKYRASRAREAKLLDDNVELVRDLRTTLNELNVMRAKANAAPEEPVVLPRPLAVPANDELGAKVLQLIAGRANGWTVPPHECNQDISNLHLRPPSTSRPWIVPRTSLTKPSRT